MTLSPQDQAKMEKTNPFDQKKYRIGSDARIEEECRRIGFVYGYTAAKKDARRLIKMWAKAAVDRYKQKKLIDAYMDERAELLNNIDAMIEDRDDAYTKRDKAEAEVGRLREAIKEVKFPTQKMIEALAPQGADTPCHECGTVGGDGRVTVCNGIITPPMPNMNTLPCPRCGTKEES